MSRTKAKAERPNERMSRHVNHSIDKPRAVWLLDAPTDNQLWIRVYSSDTFGKAHYDRLAGTYYDSI